jgi:chitinase
LGPTGANGKYALGASRFDFVFVQFYNNFCGIQSFGSPSFNFDTWNNWAKTTGTLVFLGVPADSYAGGGYQTAETVAKIISTLSSKYSPSVGGWFGGVMIWDVGVANDNVASNRQPFARTISNYLKSNSSTCL